VFGFASALTTLAVASCRVYNDWIAEFCQTDRRRLVGVAALPLQDPRGAAAEAVQAVLQVALPEEGVYALHVNLIRFGRQICLPSEPLCVVCPLNDLCEHFQHGRRRV